MSSHLPTLVAPATAGQWFDPADDLALADRLAAMPPELRDEVLRKSDDDDEVSLDVDALLYDFRFWGRPSQLHAYDSNAYVTTILGGRGMGKTRTLSEIAHRLAEKYPGSRGALVARTTHDVRATLVKGDSGILETRPPEFRPKYVPNNREVTWPNGTVAHTFTASVPDMLRGPQFHWAIGDEGAAWPHRPPAGAIANAWDNMKLATRLGDHPQIFMATTPRRVPMVIELLNGTHEDPARYRVVRGATSANRHLADVYHRTIVDMYTGTHLARQELEGELIGDIEGALLRSEQIRHLAPTARFDPLDFPIRIIAVDPSVADKPRDECGIVVIVATAQRDPFRRTAYVIKDESLHGSPAVWAARVAKLARDFRAYVVAEDNQGGEMVRMVIRAQDPDVPVTLARSETSKAVRAEPVVFAYERGQIVHADFFGEYESQLTSWVPDESTYSPDRLDAGVIGLSAALVTTPQGMGGRIRLGRPPSSASRRRSPIPTRSLTRNVTDELARAAYTSPVQIRISKEPRRDRHRRIAERRARRRAQAGDSASQASPTPEVAPVTTDDNEDHRVKR